MRKNTRSLLLTPIACCLAAAPMLAQTVTGGVTGTITDKTGAAISGAKVTAHNVGTGVDSTVVTNASGFYLLRFLPIGRYQVTVVASGFDQATVPPFDLEVLQTPTFNLSLGVGNVATNVNVSSAAPILNTSAPTLGTTFDSHAISNIPLNGLDFSALTLYTPGAVDTQGTSGTTGIERSLGYGDTPNVDGNRAQSNNYTLDGIDLNESQNNLIAYSPSPDSLAEIKVVSANAPADYGNVNGGGIVSVLKSGTNQFHGSAFGNQQSADYNANSWFNNHQDPIVPTNSFDQDQFGGTFGGPILKNKLFFFVDYLGSRYHQGGTSTASVLTAAMRTGDFSGLYTTNDGHKPIQLYDPLNGFAPFADNQVSVTNPVAKYLFAHPELYPLPNAAPSDGVISNNLQGPSRHFVANNQGDVKLEYDLSAADKFTGFYSKSVAYDGSTALIPITFPSVNNYPSQLGGLSWVHIFSPAIVNSARIGFTRVSWSRAIPTDPTGLFGLNGNSIVGIAFGKQSYVGFSNQGISGASGIGTPADDQSILDNTFSYIDDITWQRGQHLISAGIQALRYQNDYFVGNNTGFLGNLSYSGAFTSNTAVVDPKLPQGSGFGPADFDLDRVSNAGVTSGTTFVGQRQWRVAGYVEDDWKALPQLTVNFGIRYEFDQPWVEANNKTGNVDLTTGQTIYAHSIPTGAPAGSGLCSTNACYDANYDQIMPRLGFAYQLTPRLVARAGYGATSFFEGNAANQRLTSVTPFVSAVNINIDSPKPGTPVEAPRTAEEGFAIDNASDINFNGSSYNIYPQKIRPAYVQEWSLTTEYALSQSTSLQVTYLGEQGQHLVDYGNVNQYRINGDPTSAPFYNNTTLGIGSNSILITESRAFMNYNALQATLRQRLSDGLEYTFNYTYGRAMTNSLGNYGLNVGGYGSTGAFQDYYNSHADYGPSGYDIRNNISGTGVYGLPVGRGKKYLPNSNRVVDEAIGGWKLGVAGIFYSGFPQTLTGPGNNSNSYGPSRVNHYRQLKLTHQTVDNWFGTDPSATPCLTAGVDDGTCAYGVPANNAFGNDTNGSFRGPGFLNVDLSAFKDFTIIREQVIGFRFDAFNALNIASYGNPDTGITDGTFGNISNSGSPTRSTERHLQFSAHYNF
jgi:hypothetical protein